MKASAGKPFVPSSRQVSIEDLVPTGSTLMNLALSDSPHGGYMLGKMANLVGDRSSGKTFLALSMFAECARISRFDDYEFYHDDVEGGCEFDLEHLFGPRVADRIQLPGFDSDGNPAPSDTIQDWVTNISRIMDSDRPFLYVLDSFDALSSREAEDRVQAEIKAQAKGKAVEGGSYRMEKPKIGSEQGGRICRALEGTDSLLIIISQTRDNIGATFGESKRTRSGGRWLGFYCSHEIWLRVAGRIKHKDLNRQTGVRMAGKVEKNRVNGKLREFQAPIFYDYGLDDVGSTVDWLKAEKLWPMKGSRINARHFGKVAHRDDLIRWIEDNDKEKELRAVAKRGWDSIESQLRTDRKRRYI